VKQWLKPKDFLGVFKFSKVSSNYHMHNQHKIAVVTGAAGGFGRQIVQQLLAEGFCVAATDVSEEKLEDLKNSVESSEKLGLFFMDVCSTQSIQKAAEQITSIFGDCIVVLVNNAGIFERTPILLTEYYEKVKKVIDVNLIGAYYCTSIFSKFMVKRRYGRIINVASLLGIWGAGFASAYAASKAGMIAASKSWARELGSFGVCVNAIAPGVCQTQMLKRAEKQSSFSIEKRVLDFVPVGRFGNPEDVAEIVLFLATCKTDYLNGAVLTLDGGLNIGTVEITELS
jgi:3-oxoacyl-[acyl-carrier protein] reductase